MLLSKKKKKIVILSQSLMRYLAILHLHVQTSILNCEEVEMSIFHLEYIYLRNFKYSSKSSFSIFH